MPMLKRILVSLNKLECFDMDIHVGIGKYLRVGRKKKERVKERKRERENERMRE